MKSRFIVLLTALLTTSLLIGCGTERTITEPTETTKAESTTVQTEEETEEPSEEVLTEAETTESTEIAEATDKSESSEVSEPEQATEAPVVEETTSEEPAFTFTEVTATKYATQSVNVRSGPSTDFDKIGSLSTNQEVQVISRCNETGWYKFIWTDGSETYVSNKYLADEKVEVQVPVNNNSGSESTANSESASAECPYPMYQVIDDGGDSVYYYCTENDINWVIYDQCAEIIANRHGHSLYQNGGDCGKGGGLGPVKTNYTYNGQTVYRQRPCAFISPPGAGPAGATEIFQCP